jgi:hypothetical protein
MWCSWEKRLAPTWSVRDEVENVIADPLRGELKKGDLAGFRVHKSS